MPEVTKVVEIAAPPEKIFDFVTTCQSWPDWHPSSMAVRGVIDRSATVGDEIVEDVRLGLVRGTGAWKVLEYDRPRLWVIASEEWRGGARIQYDLTPIEGGRTRFQRTLNYWFNYSFLKLFDRFYLARYQNMHSGQALENMKALLEQP